MRLPNDPFAVNAPAEVRPAQTDLEALGSILKARYHRHKADRADIGRMLTRAKDICAAEGKSWLEWLAQIGIPARTAQRWMQAAANQGCDEDDMRQMAHDGQPDSADDSPPTPREDEDQADASDPDTLPPIRYSLPALRAGYTYTVVGTGMDGGAAYAELTPLPHAPEFTATSFVFIGSGDCRYQGRGFRIEAVGWEEYAEHSGFQPRGQWREEPFDPDAVPLALALDLHNIAHSSGLLWWADRMTAERRQAHVQKLGAEWGLTPSQVAAAIASAAGGTPCTPECPVCKAQDAPRRDIPPRDGPPAAKASASANGEADE
jgi:hypothetical protein